MGSICNCSFSSLWPSSSSAPSVAPEVAEPKPYDDPDVAEKVEHITTVFLDKIQGKKRAVNPEHPLWQAFALLEEAERLHGVEDVE